MHKIPKRFDHDKQLPPPPPPPPFKATSKTSTTTTSSSSNLPPPPPPPHSIDRSRLNSTSSSSHSNSPVPPPRPPTLLTASNSIQTSRPSNLQLPSLTSPSDPLSLPSTRITSGESYSNFKIKTIFPSSETSEQHNNPALSSSNSSSLFKPKTLKRRNLKLLTINDASLGAPTMEEIKDPDTKTTTDELISSMNNLELGVEYQLSIKQEDLLTLKKLGSGNSGTVSKVLHLPSKKTMARKVIHIETKETVLTQIIRELRIMHECDSQYIIGFFGAFLKEGDVVICMEYADCGSLDKVLKLSGPFPEFMLKQTAYSVLKGLIYLYDTHKIIHRDVKPSNVLMDSKGNMKLCDFGVSRELINSILDTFVGTSTYMSPERIQGNHYSVKGDIWSLGLMMIQLATGSFPFGDSSKMLPEGILDLLQRIVNEKPPSLNVADGFSPELCDFVDICLRKEKDRYEPQDLVNHPFLQDLPLYKSQIKPWAKNVRRLQKGKITILPSS